MQPGRSNSRPVPDPTGRPTPGVARGASSIASVLETLGAQGFAAEFGAGDDGRIRCGACGNDTAAGRFALEQFRRLEGASDPDEMLGIAALRCPVCGSGGTLVLTYGPQVTARDAAILQALDSPPPPRPCEIAPEPDHEGIST